MKNDFLGISITEKMRILEMHYNAAGKKLITEQSETQEPDLSKYDWSDGGNVDFQSADINKIVNYTIARDAGTAYSKLEIYGPIMQWFRDNQKSNAEEIRNSLYLWLSKNPYYGLPQAKAKMESEGYSTGDDYTVKEFSKYLEELANGWETKVINNLRGTSDIDGKVKAQLAMLPKIFREAIKNKTFPDGDVVTKMENSLNNFVAKKDKPFDGKTLPFFTNGGYTDAHLKLATNVMNSAITNIQGGKTGEKVFVDVKADDNVRGKLLMDLQKEVNTKKNNPVFRDKMRSGKVVELTTEKIVSEADSLGFTQDTTKVVGQVSGVGTQKTIESSRILKFSYPADELPQEQRDAMADNFFADDKTNISDEANAAMDEIATKIQQVISELITQYGEDKVTVQSIGIGTFASTSTVNSSFGTGEAFKTPKVFNKANNVRLVNARLQSMDTTFKQKLNEKLSEISDSQGGLTDRIVTGVKQPEPNKGPEWNTVGGENYGVTYGLDAYGPLFRAAYEKDKTLTPRKFYSQRGNNAEIKQDYEQTYAGYRKSMIGIYVSMLVPEEIAKQTPTGEFVIATSAQFSAYINWYQRSKIDIDLPKFGKLRLFTKRPKVFTPPSGGSRTACPRW